MIIMYTTSKNLESCKEFHSVVITLFAVKVGSSFAGARLVSGGGSLVRDDLYGDRSRPNVAPLAAIGGYSR